MKLEVDWLTSPYSQIWNYTYFNQHLVWWDQHLFAYYFELNALDFHIRYLSVWCSVQCLIKSKISSKVDLFHGEGLVIINQLSALSCHNLLILYYPLKIHYQLKPGPYRKHEQHACIAEFLDFLLNASFNITEQRHCLRKHLISIFGALPILQRHPQQHPTWKWSVDTRHITPAYHYGCLYLHNMPQMGKKKAISLNNGHENDSIIIIDYYWRHILCRKTGLAVAAW